VGIIQIDIFFFPEKSQSDAVTSQLEYTRHLINSHKPITGPKIQITCTIFLPFLQTHGQQVALRKVWPGKRVNKKGGKRHCDLVESFGYELPYLRAQSIGTQIE